MEESRHHSTIRLDAETTVSDFYDNLFVQCLLQHAATAHGQPSRTVPRNSLQRTHDERHKFLDNLCFLCDWRSAGKALVAIGAEGLDNGVVFRLYGQSSHLRQAGPHLEQVLASLISALDLPDERRLVESRAIAANAIVRSREKVSNYYGRLRRVLPEPSTTRDDGYFTKVL